MKSGLRNQFSVRLDQAAYKTIQTSEQKPAVKVEPPKPPRRPIRNEEIFRRIFRTQDID
jgi:hypothetical protein